MSKNILRKKILVYRKNNYRIVALKYSLLKDILKKFNLLKNKKIGAYFPINYEIDCLEILKQLEKSGHKISLPITRKKNKMDFFEWSFKEPLVISKIGIPEPFSKKKFIPILFSFHWWLLIEINLDLDMVEVIMIDILKELKKLKKY